MKCRGDIFVAPLPTLDPQMRAHRVAQDTEQVAKLEATALEYAKGLAQILESEFEVNILSSTCKTPITIAQG